MYKLKHPHNFTRHGNFGEMVVDVDLEGTGHIERISMRRITALDAPMHHGIDGIYRNMNPPPDFIIVESKYLGAEKAVDEAFAPSMSKVINGRQMDSEWIDKNLEKSVSDDLYDEIVDAIDRKKVDFVASKVTNDGNITYYKLDSSGKIMRDSDNIPVIYNINKE